MGTKNNPGKFDCYANAADDEPMFVLLGRDKNAPTLVWLWATLREINGEAPEKVAEARQCVVDMLAWAHAHGRPVSGIGESVLAGVLDLIRQANQTVQSFTNDKTDVEAVRRFLCETKIK